MYRRRRTYYDIRVPRLTSSVLVAIDELECRVACLGTHEITLGVRGLLE